MHKKENTTTVDLETQLPTDLDKRRRLLQNVQTKVRRIKSCKFSYVLLNFNIFINV